MYPPGTEIWGMEAQPPLASWTGMKTAKMLTGDSCDPLTTKGEMDL